MARFSKAEQAHASARANAIAKDRDVWVVFTDQSGAWNSERYDPDCSAHREIGVTLYRRTYDKCDRSVLSTLNAAPTSGWTVRTEYMGKGTENERSWEEISHLGKPAYEIRRGGHDHGVYHIGVRAMNKYQAMDPNDVSERLPMPERSAAARALQTEEGRR